MDIKQAQAVSRRLREDYLAVARPFGEKAADTIDALIEEVERCDEEYNKVLAEKEAHAQEDIKRLHQIEQKVDALILERDTLHAQLVKQLVKANTEPDWKDSDTLPSEGWKNPLYDFQTRLQFADGAISFRDKVIANLRQQLVRAQDNNEFALPGGGYVPPTPTPERAPAQRAVATADHEIYEFWARNKEAEKQEPAKYSDIVSDGGMDPLNKFDAAPAQESPVWTATRLWNRREIWTCPADIERDLMGCYTTTPVATTQEPLAWMCSDESLVSKGYTRFSRNREGAWNIPVYTTPLATQKEWVGLTDEDVTCLCNTAKSHDQTWGMFVREIETRIKEKNT